MNDIREELLEQIKPNGKTYEWRVYIVTLIPLFLILFYIHSMIFGTNSLIRFLTLEEEVQLQALEIEKVKNINAQLQKELFEIIEIRGNN